MDRLITTLSRVEAAGKIGATRKFIMLFGLCFAPGAGQEEETLKRGVWWTYNRALHDVLCCRDCSQYEWQVRHEGIAALQTKVKQLIGCDGCWSLSLVSVVVGDGKKAAREK